MTTGRINQVAAERVQVCLERRSRLSWRVGWYQRSLSRRSGELPCEGGLYFFKVRPRTSFELVTQKICVAPLQPSEPPKDIASLDSGSGKQRDSLHRFLEAFCLEALLSWSRLCDRAGTMGAVRLANSRKSSFVWRAETAIDPYDPQIIRFGANSVCLAITNDFVNKQRRFRERGLCQESGAIAPRTRSTPTVSSARIDAPD